MSKNRFRHVLSLLVAIGALSACSGTPKTTVAPAPGPGDLVPPVIPEALRQLQPADLPEEGCKLYDPRKGDFITPEEFDARLDESRMVYVGELHGEPDHHALQARIVNRWADAGKPVALGVEYFHYKQQPILDRYGRGELTEAEFLEAIEWDKSWGFSWDLYQPLITSAERPEVSIYGLNAPRHLSKRVFKVGLDGLDQSERRLLPEKFDTSNAAYRAFVVGVLNKHMDTPADAATQKRFFEAQLVWDETMARSILKMVHHARDAPTTRFVITAGGGHVRNGWGIPDRVLRRGVDLPRLMIVCQTVTDDWDETVSQITPDYADIVCLSRQRAKEEPSQQ